MRLVAIDAVKLPEGFFEKVDNVPKFYEWLNSLPTINVESLTYGEHLIFLSAMRREEKICKDFDDDKIFSCYESSLVRGCEGIIIKVEKIL